MPVMLSGLTVLTPAAWWAFSALAIPLLIHLFSRSRGRLVPIGHIELIRQASRLKVTELKMTQWLLLLLRLGIFTLAALILAGLATTGLNSHSAPTVYLTPGWVQAASPADREAVLDATGSQAEARVYMLQPGYPAVDRVTPDVPTHSLPANSDATGRTWPLLAERLSRERHLAPVTVYATDRVFQFGQDIPPLPGNVTWRISHPVTEDLPTPLSPHALITYTPDRVVAARLFEDALSALKAKRLPGLVWDSIELGQGGEIPANIDWLIRLGDGYPELTGSNRSGAPLAILSDAGGVADDVHSQMLSLPFYPFSQFRLERLVRGPAKPQQLAGPRSLLDSDSLDPVLTVLQSGQIRILQFNSRFDPGWSSLAQQVEFPEVLLQLMMDPVQDMRRFADARIDPDNLLAATARPGADIPLSHHSLRPWLAVLLLLLWVCERWLSERRPRDRHG